MRILPNIELQQLFEVVYPDNGIFGVVEGGRSKVVADGFI